MGDTDDRSDGLQRKLATILSADVAAYSRLMAEDEEHTLRTFRRHREVFEKLVELHHGRVFNTAGDAILAEFGSAVEAVRCATEIQAALHTRNDQLPEDRQVRFRIGVNLGDVMVQGGDLLGDGVNIAARLQSAAEPGGICISGSVYDQVRNKLSLSFAPLGAIKYKNIPQAVPTFAITQAEGIGGLPSSEKRREGRARGFPVWYAVTAILMMLAGGTGYWAYSEYQRNQAEAARQAKLAAEQAAADRARQAAEAKQRAAEAAKQQAALAAAERARQQAEAERQAALAAQKKALAEKQQLEAQEQRLAAPAPAKSATGKVAAAATPAPPRLPPSMVQPGETGALDGIYRGQICYGPSPLDQARCYRAQAILRHGTMTGQWPSRFPGATMYLAGDVSPSGDVAIHMHAERKDGSHFAVIDLTGTLRNGSIDAAGGFLNGRHVSLHWQKE
jgi:class 3 adenylate cyclase